MDLEPPQLECTTLDLEPFTSTVSSDCPECPRKLRFIQDNPLRRGNLL
jgi:hypothetical protein